MTAQPLTPDRESPSWVKLRHNEPCEHCGHRGYCMYNTVKVYCMFDAAGAMQTYIDKAGNTVGIYPRTDAPPPTPLPVERHDERPDWERPNPLTCRLLYTKLAAFCTAEPTAAGAEADRRRFGAFAADVAAVADAVYLRDEAGFLRWLRDEGRALDAKNAGLLRRTDALALSPAIRRRKLYLYRHQGQVWDIRGRAVEPGEAVKVRSLAGSREARGCAGIWYQHDRIAAAPGGHIVIAGGHEKADAFNAAGIPALGANEGQASDAMIAALVDGGIMVATLPVDAEQAKEGKPLSEGQRLALQLGERLEAAGITVRLAEPEREPGAPKVDADSLLRDRGPEALREMVRRAVPLAVYRQRLGVEPAPTALVREMEEERAARRRAEQRADRLERDLALCHETSDRLLGELRETVKRTEHEKQALRKVVVHDDQALAGPAYGLATVVQESMARGHAITEGGVTYYRAYTNAVAAAGGGSTDKSLKARRRFEESGKVRCLVRREPVRTIDRKTGAEIEIVAPINYVHVEGQESGVLAMVNTLLATPRQKDAEGREKKHGGARQPRPQCAAHPEAGTLEKVSTRKTTYCAECLAPLDSEVAQVSTFYDEDGNRLDPPATPQDAASAGPPATAPPMPQDAAPINKGTVPQPALWVDEDEATPQDAAWPEPTTFPGPRCSCGRPATVGRYCENHTPDRWGSFVELRGYATGAD